MALLVQGYQVIAGTDEVGRGALAGPVVAAAVILPFPLNGALWGQVRDSKELPPLRRETLCRGIRGAAVSVGVGVVGPEVIDSRGIVPATRQAIAGAVAALFPAPQFLLADWIKLPELSIPYRPLVKGDQRCVSIACASIVAKVFRDDIMRRMSRTYPGYGFARHKGYGTPRHLRCLRERGCCPIHRRSFAPVAELSP
ncbi:MAG: ribonuclease HII [Dehalococcoidia bacterium]